MRWDPETHHRFSGQQERPAGDLLARLPLAAPTRIVDLGCGTGNLTLKLAARWPVASVLGVDSSPAMLSETKVAGSENLRWETADIGEWAPPPDAVPDLIVANASLHRVPDHASLFPRLLGSLAPGGCLAVQMPRSGSLPAHRLLRETPATGDGHVPFSFPRLFIVARVAD